MRFIFVVVRDMIAVVPQHYDLYVALTQFYKQLEKQAAYLPPECMHSYWDQLANIVNMYIHEPLTDDWEFKFISIFTEKTIQELKSEQDKRMNKG